MQRRLPDDCGAAAAIDDDIRMLVAAAGVSDGRKDESRGWSVEPGDLVAEVDQRIAGPDRGGDAQESLLSPGQAPRCSGMVSKSIQ